MPLELSDEDRAEIRAQEEFVGTFQEESEAMYLAGMRAGIERAAKVCDDIQEGYRYDTVGDYGAGQAAAELRALLA